MQVDFNWLNGVHRERRENCFGHIESGLLLHCLLLFHLLMNDELFVSLLRLFRGLLHVYMNFWLLLLLVLMLLLNGLSEYMIWLDTGLLLFLHMRLHLHARVLYFLLLVWVWDCFHLSRCHLLFDLILLATLIHSLYFLLDLLNILFHLFCPFIRIFPNRGTLRQDSSFFL